jgi:molybdate transport system substrate-binding protein
VRTLSRSMRLIVLILATALPLISTASLAGEKPKQEVLVAAAASLKDVFEEIGPLFAKEYPDDRVIFQFAASGVLQQQIEQGAPIDIMVSAAQQQINALLDKDLLVKDSAKSLCSNSLVLVIPSGRKPMGKLNELKEDTWKRIAIGERKTVPAGEYASQWIEKVGLTAALKDKLIPAANVRQVLTFVESGNVDAGFVYKSDALASPKVTVALQAETSMHEAILYPFAITKRAAGLAAARNFSQFLQSKTVRAVLEKHGFLLPPGKAS